MITFTVLETLYRTASKRDILPPALTAKQHSDYLFNIFVFLTIAGTVFSPPPPFSFATCAYSMLTVTSGIRLWALMPVPTNTTTTTT